MALTLPICADARPATHAAAASSREDEATVPQTGKVVLAIDDDPNVIDLLQENLTEAGYHVIGAASGEEGLQRARELRPFAITLDILMPQQDGWQMLEQDQNRWRQRRSRECMALRVRQVLLADSERKLTHLRRDIQREQQAC